MDKANVADNKPYITELEKGKTYAWCACGLSKNENGAFCDGSHKTTNFKPIVFEAQETKKVALCMCKQSKNPPYCDGSHVDY